MSDFPQWDQKVYWAPGAAFAVDRVSGRRAFYGPLGEGGTPDQSTANAGFGDGNFAGWTQPDGAVVFYQPVQGWIETLLAAIGAPLGLVNDQAMALWFQSEGTPPEANNPCATLRTGYGEHYVVPWTAPFYPNRFAGQRAWVDTLTIADPIGYQEIIYAFRNQVELVHIWDAINHTPWCGGCQGGKYPVAMWNQVVASGQAGTIAPPYTGPPISGTGEPGTLPSFPPPGASGPPTVDGVPEAWGELTDSLERHVPNAVADLIGVQNKSPLGG